MLRKLLVLIFALSLTGAYAQQTSKVLVATGKQVQVQNLSPGVWICEGGQTTASGPPFCTPGSTKIFFWNMSNKYVQQDVAGSAAAMVGGENITTVHGNFDGTYYGHMWGTFQWSVPEMEGRWEGTFSAVADQMKGLVVNKAVGYGVGGKLEGLKLEFIGVNAGSMPGTFFAIITNK